MNSGSSRKARQPIRMWIPYFAMALALLLTALAAYYVSATSDLKDRARFESSVRKTEDNIEKRLETYIALLQAGAGLFMGSRQVTRDEFQEFIGRLGLRTRYPGIQGIGFTVKVKPEERDSLIESMRRQGVPDFRIRPEEPRAEYHAIIYLEPLDRRNKAAIGFDMFSEHVRRAAMEKARDTGLAAASGKVTLVQEIDEQKQAGFLIYVPVYRKGPFPETEAARREALVGFVYSPFRADDLLEGILADERLSDISFQVYDGGELKADYLLHDSGGDAGTYRPRFNSTTQIDVAGRAWRLVFAARPEFAHSSSRWLVPYIWLGGLVVGLVLFAVTRAQALARAEAERAADELRQSEQALRESESRFRALVEQSPLSTQILAPDGRTIQVNGAWERLWGAKLEELDGYNLLEDEQLVKQGLMTHIKKAFGGEATPLPAIPYRPDRGALKGHSLWTRAFIYPVKDESGTVSEVVLMHEDITESKQAEEERALLLARERKARREAEAANRSKDEFLATVSHELRTPLNAILGWAQLLRGGRLDASARARALEAIESNARSQAQLIEDILDVSRIITGKLPLNIRLVDLPLVIEGALDSVRPAAEAKAIALEKEIDASASQANGDPDRLRQVVWNLLSNAIKFTPRGGRVTVSLRHIGPDRVRQDSETSPEPYIEIAVSDTGQGIAAEFLPYVFDRFSQADSSLTRQHGGLGLGLAIVRHIVEMHGGTVYADSPGEKQGSTFSVRLPLLGAQAEAAGSQARPGFAADSAPHEAGHIDGELLRDLRLLIVDDDADTREVLTAVLEHGGAEVKACASAGEAIRAFPGWRPDILISDIAMPGEDGYTLISKIRAMSLELGGQIPALALTARAKPEDCDRALAAGFQMHMAKPVDSSRLIEAVARLRAGVRKSPGVRGVNGEG